MKKNKTLNFHVIQIEKRKTQLLQHNDTIQSLMLS